jgi:DNA (cytosine-5)-methyltransferase 1
VKHSYVTCTDMFCGAGGSSLGASRAGAEIKLAMNHWRLAIDTHNSNFPDTDHDCADISASDPRRYGSTDILIASPECTSHSIAKGRKRKRYEADLFGEMISSEAEDRSRATMWDVPRFAEHHRYNIIIVENVVDARDWILYDSWLHAMHALGYEHRAVYFNSMFAWPTPQSRDRMYVVFWRRGNKAPDLDFHPLAFCPKCDRQCEARQVWKNVKRQYGRYGARGQYLYACPSCATTVHPYYYPALTAIDWTLPNQRIGDRKVPLKENTLRRIRLGLERFAGQQLVVNTAYAHALNNRASSVADAWPTQTTAQTLALLAPFLVRHTGAPGDPNCVIEVTDPLGTQVASNSQHALIGMPLHGSNQTHHVPKPVTDALETVLTGGHQYVVADPAFVGVQRTTSTPRGLDESIQTVVADNQHFIVELRKHSTASSVADVLATVCANGNHHALVMPFLTRHYTNTSEAALSRPVTEPTGAVTSADHHSLTIPFLASYYGQDTLRTVADAMGTQTGNDKHSLVMPFTASFYGDGKHAAITDAMGTQIGTQHQGVVVPEPPDIEDCGFRMLEPHEIGRAMAFPDEYIVLGNKRERVKQLGNAVTPPVLEMIMERCIATLRG